MGISEELPRPPCWLRSVGTQLPLTSQLEQSWTTQLLGTVTGPSGQMRSGCALPSALGYDSAFFTGCRQTRLEDWQTLFEDQRQGDVHPSGFSGQSELSNWVCRISKFLGGNELHLVFESPFPLLCHSQILVILHAIPQSAPQCWDSCLKPIGSLFPLEEPETRGRPLSRVLCWREGEAVQSLCDCSYPSNMVCLALGGTQRYFCLTPQF